jgi:hypothetical protein
MIELIHTSGIREAASSDQDDNLLYILQFTLPICLFLLCAMPIVVLMLVFVRHVDALLDILLSLDQTVKESAKAAIRRDRPLAKMQTVEERIQRQSWTSFTVAAVFTSFAGAMLLFGMVWAIYDADMR